jgi:HAD superfamily hydrolase (TIGR01549 family)
MPLRGVIFDMGGTLLHYNAPGNTWEDTEKIGTGAVYQLLHDQGHSLPPRDLALALSWKLAARGWETLVTGEYDVNELKLDRQMRTLAEKYWNVTGLSSQTVGALSEAYMTAIQAHVSPQAGARETLAVLRQHGYRVGLVSNTVWPAKAHLSDLARYELSPYLEHFLFSADAEAWKPYREIFKMSLAALGLKPEEAIYVGDSLFFDVHGAQQAGLRGVWIEQAQPWLPDGIEVSPDATIKSLPDLLSVVEAWQ